MKMRNILIKIVLPVAILVAGFAGMRIMALSKESPRKQIKGNPGVLVETLSVKPADRDTQIRATGTVQPGKSVEIVPQVSGRVVSMAPGFAAGGFFKEGELLFEIDPADYKLAAEKSRAGVVAAEYELARMESRARVAKTEWKRIRLENKGDPNPLVLYEPQMKNAKAALISAKADHSKRLLDIERTKVYAPFNGRIHSESIDPGQYLSAGKGIAVITGTDVAEIVIPVPLDVLEWVTVPRFTTDKEKGSPVRVQINAGQRSFTWKGQIDRSLGEVDPRGRMIRLVVRVDDPYNLKGMTEKMPIDLAAGMFVEVQIQGKSLSNIFIVPAKALRDNSTVWVANQENQLDIRPVRIIRKEKADIMIDDGLTDGDLVILTNISGASPGMKLRLVEKEAGV